MYYNEAMTSQHDSGEVASRGTALTIRFGLVAVPVRVMTAAATIASVPKRSMFTPEGNPVGYDSIDKVTGKPVEKDSITKKTEVGKGTWVDLTDDEIERMCETVKGSAEIECFIPLGAIGSTYVVESRSYVVPGQRKVNNHNASDPAADRAFALLMAVMAEENVAALISYPTRSASRYAAVTPDGRMLGLYFAAEVKAQPEIPTEVSYAELALARQLVAGVGIGTPVLVDRFAVTLRDFLAARAAGEQPVAALPTDTSSNVIDLVAALEASVAAAKKAKAS